MSPLFAKKAGFATAFGLGCCLTCIPASGEREPRRCAATVLIDSRLDVPWTDAVNRLRAELDALEGCAPLTLAVIADGPGARLVATAPSGAKADRGVAQPSWLRSLALGLVLSIPAESAPPPVALSPLEIPPDEPILPPHPRAPAPRTKPAALVSMTVGARLGMPTRVVADEIGFGADALVDDWFLAARVRYAPLGESLVRPGIPGYAYDEIALGLGIGRRFDLGPAMIDLALTPTIVIMTEEGDLPADGAGGTDDELRCDFALRAMFGSARLRPVFIADFEVAPYVVRSPTHADTMLPSFPSWTVGLGAGIAGNVF